MKQPHVCTSLETFKLTLMVIVPQRSAPFHICYGSTYLDVSFIINGR